MIAGKKLLSILAPTIGAITLLALWAAAAEFSTAPSYIFPSPKEVTAALFADWGILAPALFNTAKTTLGALLVATAGGVGLAVLLSQSRWIENFFSPILVILQVTPIVAIAPLILIYAPTPQMAQLGCAFIVTFFPIMMNTLHGLKNVDRELASTVQLYTASRWKMLTLLQLPSALPSFFAGLKIGGGLALVGAVVAEFAAGSAGADSGIAFRLLEAQFRLNTPRLYAALVLLALLGAVIFSTISIIDRIVLRHWYAAKAASDDLTSTQHEQAG